MWILMMYHFFVQQQLLVSSNEDVIKHSLFQFEHHTLHHRGIEQCISMQVSYIYIVLSKFSCTHSETILWIRHLTQVVGSQ